MELIKRVYKGFSNWLERVNQESEWDNAIRNLNKPTINIREVIPGWDDDYPEPIFDDNWELSSEINQDTDTYFTTNFGSHPQELVDFFERTGAHNYVLRVSDEDDEFDIEAQSDFTGFTDDETQYLNLSSTMKIDGCTSCKYFHGTQYNDIDLVCGIHPYGNTNCPDFEDKHLTDLVEEIEPEEETIWLTEEEELRGTYKHYYEFVKDAEWVSDDLEHYLGKYEG